MPKKHISSYAARIHKIFELFKGEYGYKSGKVILNILALCGYTLGTVISFLVGVLIFQTTPKKFPWDDQWLMILGHRITNDNVLIEYIQWSTSFALGYLFTILLCPRKYKVYVATICAIAISIRDWMYEASIVGPDFSGKPDPGIWPFLIPLVVGYLTILLTCRIETVVYRKSVHKERIGLIIGAVPLVIFALFLLLDYILIS